MLAAIEPDPDVTVLPAEARRGDVGRTPPGGAGGELLVPDRLDVPFTVPFTHRVRFTGDVLEAADGRAARVLAVVESGVDAAAGVGGRLGALAGRHRAAVELVDVVRVDGGEGIKDDPGRLLPVLRAVLDHDVDRRNYVLAVGGGRSWTRPGSRRRWPTGGCGWSGCRRRSWARPTAAWG